MSVVNLELKLEQMVLDRSSIQILTTSFKIPDGSSQLFYFLISDLTLRLWNLSFLLRHKVSFILITSVGQCFFSPLNYQYLTIFSKFLIPLRIVYFGSKESNTNSICHKNDKFRSSVIFFKTESLANQCSLCSILRNFLNESSVLVSLAGNIIKKSLWSLHTSYLSILRIHCKSEIPPAVSLAILTV